MYCSKLVIFGVRVYIDIFSNNIIIIIIATIKGSEPVLNYLMEYLLIA